MLAHLDIESPISIAVDASNSAIGVLQKWINFTWRPLAFFSKWLQDIESRWRTFSSKLLAMYYAVRHCQYFLEDQEFTLFTGSSSNKYSSRECRLLDYISLFTWDIQNLSRENNVVLGALFRVPFPKLRFKQLVTDKETLIYDTYTGIIIPILRKHTKHFSIHPQLSKYIFISDLSD